MDLHFIIFFCMSLLSFKDRSIRVALSRVFPFSFSPVCPRSCVAVWVIQVIMVNKCAISTETLLWSGTSSVSACLHAAELIGGGIFSRACRHFLHRFTVFKEFPRSIYICVCLLCVHVAALPIPTLWPGSLGPLLPRATPTGDPKELVDKVLNASYNVPLTLI